MEFSISFKKIKENPNEIKRTVLKGMKLFKKALYDPNKILVEEKLNFFFLRHILGPKLKTIAYSLALLKDNFGTLSYFFISMST